MSSAPRPSHSVEWWERTPDGDRRHSGVWLDVSGGEWGRALALCALDLVEVEEGTVHMTAIGLDGELMGPIATDLGGLLAWSPARDPLPSGMRSVETSVARQFLRR